MWSEFIWLLISSQSFTLILFSRDCCVSLKIFLETLNDFSLKLTSIYLNSTSFQVKICLKNLLHLGHSKTWIQPKMTLNLPNATEIKKIIPNLHKTCGICLKEETPTKLLEMSLDIKQALLNLFDMLVSFYLFFFPFSN